MTATTVARKTLEQDRNDNLRVTMATSAGILEGCMVCLNSSGLACDPDGSNAAFVVGIARKTIASAAAGEQAEVRKGRFWFVNGGSFTEADRFKPCYAADNQTVDATSTNPVAGVIVDVDSVKGVCVDIDPERNRLLPTLGAAGALNYSNGIRFVNLPIGTAAQILGVNADATAPEWEADDIS